VLEAAATFANAPTQASTESAVKKNSRRLDLDLAEDVDE
jgi:hypothetical protein